MTQLSFEDLSRPQRELPVYAFDPSLSGRRENHVVITLPKEPLGPGPVGEKVAVIDYDITNDCYYSGIDLDTQPHVLSPSESNPQFHQQMAYAVSMDTIRRFEVALGRSVRWPESSLGQGRLTILPHAMHEANAYYVPKLGALLFGYFHARTTEIRGTFPGQTIFTCLSHDIIVHEMVHAIVHSVHKYSLEPTGPDAFAFHEGFADVIAILQHFSFKDALLQAIHRTGGLIHRPEFSALLSRSDPEDPIIESERPEPNPLVELAKQFGDAMGRRKALRAALNSKPNPRALENTDDPHDRGAILVAAVFDAFFSVFVNRTRDLLRIAGVTAKDHSGHMNADLANRLAEEAAGIARRLERICIRALDYCPGVDITFGDYLRALITADLDVAPDDAYGFRSGLIAAFRARGIRPSAITSYSEDALRWDSEHPDVPTEVFRTLVEILRATPPDQPLPVKSKTIKYIANGLREQFGLSGYSSTSEVPPLKALVRTYPDRTTERQVLFEYIEQKTVPLEPGKSTSPTFQFRGGVTVLVDSQARVRCIIGKSIDDSEPNSPGARRLERERKFRNMLAQGFDLAPHIDFDPDSHWNLKNLHGSGIA